MIRFLSADIGLQQASFLLVTITGRLAEIDATLSATNQLRSIPVIYVELVPRSSKAPFSYGSPQMPAIYLFCWGADLVNRRRWCGLCSFVSLRSYLVVMVGSISASLELQIFVMADPRPAMLPYGAKCRKVGDTWYECREFCKWAQLPASGLMFQRRASLCFLFSLM